ncbi:MAG TPA: nucleotidyltransferase family protein [Thermoanaerobaculia bacterium]|jgi:molybdenum cofactor cytidylyltransferase|nr:nucleotidyltransferase family protein [Thermoanaerobaculia bacterium]
MSPDRSEPPLPVAGILLAAGTSSRMGTNKMLLDINGESVLHRAARHTREAGLDPLLVVLGHEAERARLEIADLPCRVVINEQYEMGIASSLRAGFAALPPECGAAVVLLADMPHVTAEMLAALVAHYRTTGARLVASQFGEVKAPPTLYDASLFPELAAVSDVRCAQQVVKRHLDEAVVLSWPEARLADLDRPEDWARLGADLPLQPSPPAPLPKGEGRTEEAALSCSPLPSGEGPGVRAADA